MNLNASWLDIMPGIGKLRMASRLIGQAGELNRTAERLVAQVREVNQKCDECCELARLLLDGERTPENHSHGLTP